MKILSLHSELRYDHWKMELTVTQLDYSSKITYQSIPNSVITFKGMELAPTITIDVNLL